MTSAHVLQDPTGPDVWLQLLLQCVEERNCRNAALSSLAQQLAGDRSAAVHRALTMQHMQELHQQQRQIDSYERRIEEQQEQIWQQEQQLEMRDLQAAKQAAQIAELEGRLQEVQAVVQQLLQRQPLGAK